MRVTHLKTALNADKQPCQDKNLTHWYRVRAYVERCAPTGKGLVMQIWESGFDFSHGRGVSDDGVAWPSDPVRRNTQM